MYQDTTDIELRKAELRKAITAKENEIANLWDTIFNPPESNAVETPTQKAIHFAHTAAGVFDGALLGWKLYRKLNGMFSLRKGKKR